jgi:hypothetical protein
MSVDLFAGIAVRDYAGAAAWYERLVGAPPSFLPNDFRDLDGNKIEFGGASA